jgi:hypothetical protein
MIFKVAGDIIDLIVRFAPRRYAMLFLRIEHKEIAGSESNSNSNSGKAKVAYNMVILMVASIYVHLYDGHGEIIVNVTTKKNIHTETCIVVIPSRWLSGR